MKLWIWFIIIPMVLIGGALTVVFIYTRPPALTKEAAMVSDSLLTELPLDHKQAQKEMEKAQVLLAKLQPTKPYIVIDTHANQLYLRTEDSIIFKGTCSTGSGGVLIDSLSGRKWSFATPRGVFKVTSKLADPWWRKPDWAYMEDNEPIPSDPSERLDPEMLGAFAMGFGNDYYIHGTIYERLLGVSVTHGCVRLGSDDLKKLYDMVPIGTPVYIF
jgi:lipoprotein-anchoring transpeptidase ErfK/SrfK